MKSPNTLDDERRGGQSALPVARMGMIRGAGRVRR
jgi:hypothetical protein